MFNKRTTPSMIDLLFNLVLTFGCLFAISYLLVNDPVQKDNDVDNSNMILISMTWNVDCDIDLWVMLPDGRKVFYNNREEPPAFLDVDMRMWRVYYGPDNVRHVIEGNEEIVSVRSVLQGEYAVNAHFFSANRHYENLPEVEVEIIVQNVINGNTIYAGTKTLSLKMVEQHFVRFTIEGSVGESECTTTNVYIDRPVFFVGNN